MLAKVKFVQVPYRGSAPALQGLVAGDVDIMFDNLGVSLALVQSRQLKLIAVGTERRMASLPNVPTIAETLPGFVSSAWFAVVAPPRTPQPIAQMINADIDAALRQPDIVARLKDLSAEAVGGASAAEGTSCLSAVRGAPHVAAGIKFDERLGMSHRWHMRGDHRRQAGLAFLSSNSAPRPRNGLACDDRMGGHLPLRFPRSPLW